jgi:heat shock protein HslJ
MTRYCTARSFFCSALLLGIAACSDTAERDPPMDTAAEAREAASAREAAFRASLGREWELARLGSTELPASVPRDSTIPPGDPHPGIRPTIRFAEDPSGAGGRSFCNGYGGPFLLRGDSLRIPEIVSTAVGCDNTDSLETRFFRALRETRRFAFAGDTLSLLGADSSRLLLFVPRT